MMERIVHLEARHPYRLFVRFDDGTEGEDDIGPRMRGPMFEPLRDPSFFARVRLSEDGAPVWPNGLDLAPDALYERIRTTVSAARSG
jgi:hypothetical protein